MPGRYILPAISAVSVLLSIGLAASMPTGKWEKVSQ